ncbi:MAG: type II secretion system protein [Chloroflexi bacterium]|nr:type II secretion system protein [Chloroflexota bacterium]
MKKGERGFTLIELLLVIALIASLGIAASATTVQILAVTNQNKNHVNAIRQVQNAGYWITKDALISELVTVDTNPQTAEFLVFTWTQWGYDEDSVYHTVTYRFEGLSGGTSGIGKLKRTHTSSAGANETTLIADNIFYNASDPANSTNASYQPLKLTLQVVTSDGGATETRAYKIWLRPNF